MFRLVAWKSIAVAVGVAGVAILGYDLIGLQRDGVSAHNQSPVSHPFYFNATSPLVPETAMVPAGTRIQIRLEEAINPWRNSSGDRFAASLFGPLWIDGEYLVPSRSRIVGQLTKVDFVGPIGHSRLTMVLRKLILNRQEYRFETLPLTIETTADPNADSAVRSATGGGFGAGYTLLAKRPLIVNGSQSSFTLTLSSPVELPVIRRVGGKHVGEWPNHLGFVSHEMK